MQFDDKRNKMFKKVLPSKSQIIHEYGMYFIVQFQTLIALNYNNHLPAMNFAGNF